MQRREFTAPNADEFRWIEEQGTTRLIGRWYTTALHTELDAEPWTFVVTAADGTRLFERALTITYAREEANGPGCGVCVTGSAVD
ncbi:MAG TPA: hypothetical protein VK524_03530 [Polyangiaceae bacterium]|nr:hypothetical protein [Polyangiaceae bacterium]